MMPPIKAVGSWPASERMWVSRAEVLVFPWVPATAKQRFSLAIPANASARLMGAKGPKKAIQALVFGMAGVNTTVVSSGAHPG